MQKRVLMMTDLAIYNLDPSNFKCKRRISLRDLGAICLSQLNDNFFSIRVPSGRYYRHFDFALSISLLPPLTSVSLSHYCNSFLS